MESCTDGVACIHMFTAVLLSNISPDVDVVKGGWNAMLDDVITTPLYITSHMMTSSRIPAVGGIRLAVIRQPYESERKLIFP